MIKNLQIYGLDNAVRVSKFPMLTDTDTATTEITNTVNKLGTTHTGTGHNNFLKGIIVQFDLTVTNKIWVEAERYHWFDIVSSQSTMHKLTSMKLTDENCIEYVTDEIKEKINWYIHEYNISPTTENYLKVLYNCPSGLKLTAGITTNYLQLKTIYNQRKNHRLPEWREFCKIIETLPCSEWITNNSTNLG